MSDQHHEEHVSIHAALRGHQIFMCGVCGQDRVYGYSPGEVVLTPEELEPLLYCMKCRANTKHQYQFTVKKDGGGRRL